MTAVKISLIADAAGVTKGVKQAGEDLHGLNKAAASLSKTLKGALGAGVAYAGFQTLKEGVLGSYEAFEKHEVLAKQTDLVLKNVGLSAQLSGKQVEGNATALSKQTGISRDAIQASENLLLRNQAFAKELAKHPSLLAAQEKSILDVAEANDKTGASTIDLTQVTKAYGRAIADPVGALGAFTRAGVALTAQQKAQIKATAGGASVTKAAAAAGVELTSVQAKLVAQYQKGGTITDAASLAGVKLTAVQRLQVKQYAENTTAVKAFAQAHVPLTVQQQDTIKQYTAQSGAVQALTKAGVELTASQKRQIQEYTGSSNVAKASSLLLADVATRVKGVAEASDTPTKQLSANIETLKQQAGGEFAKAITPAIATLSNWTTELQNGKGPLEDFAKAGQGVIGVGKDLVDIGEPVVHLLGKIPAPVYTGVAAFLAWKLAADKLAGSLGLVAAAETEVAAGSARASRGARSGAIATAAAAAPAGRSYPGANAISYTSSTYRTARDLGRGRAQSGFAAVGGLAGLGESATLRSAGKGAAIGGAIGVATSGGNVLQGAISGAATGSIAGPWGAVGGLIAGAAGSELIHIFNSSGKDAARKLGEEIAHGSGFGGTTSDQKKLISQTKKLQHDQQRGGLGGNANPNASKVAGDQVALAQTRISTAGHDLGQRSAITGAEFVKKIKSELAGLGPAGQKAGAESALALAKSLAAEGKLPSKAASDLAHDLGISYRTNLHKALSTADADDTFGKYAHAGADQLRRVLGHAVTNTGIAADAKVNYRQLVTVSTAGLAQLQAKIDESHKEGATKQAAAFQAEYNALKTAQKKYVADLQTGENALDQMGVNGARALQGITDAAARTQAALSGITATSTKKALKSFFGSATGNRTGGLIAAAAFAAGGLVPSIVSPGEALAFPGGGISIVPGARVAADTVPMMLPPGTAVLTDDMQARLGAGQSLSQVLRDGAPHFAKGGVVGASMFGGPSDPGTGHIGYRGDDLNKHPDSYAELNMGKSLGGLPYLAPLTVAGPKGSERIYKRDIGLGGGPVNGHARAIDLWYKVAQRIGINGTGLVTIGGKSETATAVGKPATGQNASALVSGAFGAGMQRAASGVADNAWGYAGVSAALGALTQARSTASQGRKTVAKATLKATGGLPTSAKPIPGVQSAIGQYAGAVRQKFGLQWPSLGQTTGGTHAPGSYHYQGRAVDLSGSPSAMAAAAAFVSSHTPANLLEGIHKTGLSVKNGQHVPSSVWGKSVWNEHANHVHLAMRRGGIVGRLRAGGVVAGGNRMLSTALKGGTSRSSLTGIAEAVQDATSSFIDAQITTLQKQIPSLSGAARRQAQAHLSVLEDSLGQRVGAVIARAAGQTAGLAQNQTALGYLQRIKGIDASSSIGLQQQQDTDQRFLSGSGATYKALQAAANQAVRKHGASSSDAQTAEQAVTDFGNQIMSVSADVADLGRSIIAAKTAEDEATRISYQQGTGSASDFAGARAALADAQSGNNSASTAYTAARLAAVTVAEQQAENSGDTTQATDLLNQEASLTAALKQLDTTSQELADQQSALASLTQQMVDNQTRLMAFAQNQQAALTGAIVSAVNGTIGGQVGLGVQAPGWAGAGARY